MADEEIERRSAGPTAGKSNKISNKMPRSQGVAEADTVLDKAHRSRVASEAAAAWDFRQAHESKAAGATEVANPNRRWQGGGQGRGNVQRGGRREKNWKGKENGLARIGEDMKARLAECAPTENEAARTDRCVRELEEIVQQLGPGWKLRLFGSVESGFGTRYSDIDATILRDDPPSPAGEEVQQPQSAAGLLLERVGPRLREHDHFSIQEEILGAKVPILKCRFGDDLDVDLSYQNKKALQNTRLLKAYASIDPRVRDLGIAVKLWARAAGICGASQGNLSSYTFTLMVIYFMQIHPDVMLPCLPVSAFQENDDVEDEEGARLFAEAVEAGRMWSKQCKLSLIDLSARFFYFYSAYFLWGQEVVSPRLGLRHFRNDEVFGKLRGRWSVRLHVEDPFILERNLHCVLGDPEEARLLNGFKEAVRFIHMGRTPVGMRPEHSAPMPQPQWVDSPVLDAAGEPAPAPVGAVENASEGNSGTSANASPVVTPGMGPVLTPPVMALDEPAMRLEEAAASPPPEPVAAGPLGVSRFPPTKSTTLRLDEALPPGAVTSPGGFSKVSTAANSFAMTEGSPSPFDTSGGESQSSADEKAAVSKHSGGLLAMPLGGMPGLSEEKLNVTQQLLRNLFKSAQPDVVHQGNPQEAEKPTPSFVALQGGAEKPEGKWWQNLGADHVWQQSKGPKEEAGPNEVKCVTMQDLENQMRGASDEGTQDVKDKTKRRGDRQPPTASINTAAASAPVLLKRPFVSGTTSKIMGRVSKALGELQASEGCVQFQ